MVSINTRDLAPVDVAFDNLCEQLAVWKCGQVTTRALPGLATGFPALDAALPGRGWPTSALLELLSDTIGIGELSLLLPAISQISSTKGVVFIAPPFVPYAPAFAEAGVDLRRLLVIHQCTPRDALASAELALRSGACGAVAIWESCLFERPTQSINYLALRRLHLAAERGNAMAILFRSDAPFQATIAGGAPHQARPREWPAWPDVVQTQRLGR